MKTQMFNFLNLRQLSGYFLKIILIAMFGAGLSGALAQEYTQEEQKVIDFIDSYLGEGVTENKLNVKIWLSEVNLKQLRKTLSIIEDRFGQEELMVKMDIHLEWLIHINADHLQANINLIDSYLDQKTAKSVTYTHLIWLASADPAVFKRNVRILDQYAGKKGTAAGLTSRHLIKILNMKDDHLLKETLKTMKPYFFNFSADYSFDQSLMDEIFLDVDTEKLKNNINIVKKYAKKNEQNSIIRMYWRHIAQVDSKSLEQNFITAASYIGLGAMADRMYIIPFGHTSPSFLLNNVNFVTNRIGKENTIHRLMEELVTFIISDPQMIRHNVDIADFYFGKDEVNKQLKNDVSVFSAKDPIELDKLLKYVRSTIGVVPLKSQVKNGDLWLMTANLQELQNTQKIITEYLGSEETINKMKKHLRNIVEAEGLERNIRVLKNYNVQKTVIVQALNEALSRSLPVFLEDNTQLLETIVLIEDYIGPEEVIKKLNEDILWFFETDTRLLKQSLNQAKRKMNPSALTLLIKNEQLKNLKTVLGRCSTVFNVR